MPGSRIGFGSITRMSDAIGGAEPGKDETTMKFGYFTLTDNAPAYGDRRREPGTFIREVLEECVEAEAMGFNSAWVPEHHLGAFGVLPSPWILLAQVAARTTRL